MPENEVQTKISNKEKMLADLKDNRSYLRRKITIRCNQISGSFSGYTHENCIDSLEYLKTFSEKLFDLDEQIGTIIVSQNSEEKT